MTVRVPITEEMVEDAICTRDRVDGYGQRDDTDAFDDSVRGRVVEIAVETGLFTLYEEFFDWEHYEGYEYDYRLWNSERDLKFEIKGRDSFKLEAGGIDPREADLPVRVREDELHADRYVLAVIHGWEYVEIVGIVDRETVQQADYADWTEHQSKVVERRDVSGVPTPE